MDADLCDQVFHHSGMDPWMPEVRSLPGKWVRT